MKKKNFKAYMTLEVSLLFPIIFTVLLCTIYLTFYSYNRTIAYQNLLIAGMYAQNSANTETIDVAFKGRTYRLLENLNKNQYLALDNLKQVVCVEGKELKQEHQGTMTIPFLTKDIQNKLDFYESVTLDIQNNIFYIRQIRKLKNE